MFLSRPQALKKFDYVLISFWPFTFRIKRNTHRFKYEIRSPKEVCPHNENWASLKAISRHNIHTYIHVGALNTNMSSKIFRCALTDEINNLKEHILEELKGRRRTTTIKYIYFATASFIGWMQMLSENLRISF